MTNVKNYTDKQILARIESHAEGYTHFPNEYFHVFIRSNEDAPDRFDDKDYLFFSKNFIGVTSCTTNSGTYGLLNFHKWNKKGAAMIKADQAYYDCWKNGLHKGKMPALVQTGGKVIVSRDNNKNLKSEDFGNYETGYFGINIHTITYSNIVELTLRLIGKWGVGCLVLNNSKIYREWIKLSESQKSISAFVLNEW